jgi:hypothetical protein
MLFVNSLVEIFDYMFQPEVLINKRVNEIYKLQGYVS